MESLPWCLYAVAEAAAKIVAMGGSYHTIRLTLQEYFEKLGADEKWGKPFSALLGAHYAQMQLESRHWRQGQHVGYL